MTFKHFYPGMTVVTVSVTGRENVTGIGGIVIATETGEVGWESVTTTGTATGTEVTVATGAETGTGGGRRTEAGIVIGSGAAAESGTTVVATSSVPQ